MALQGSQTTANSVISHGDEHASPRVDKERRHKKYLPKLSCFRPATAGGGEDRVADMVVESTANRPPPTHLVIFVNGLVGSAQNWRYAAKHFLRKYPQDVIAHCSECNSSSLTFDGVDVMGDRLTDEVLSVRKRYPDVQKISFLCHSLGGLVARYAIARLFEPDVKTDYQGNGDLGSDRHEDACHEKKFGDKIAGLEPMNFITCATPHLGSRGHKQVPAFCGLYPLEIAASRASQCLGRSGKHLFLTDNDNGKPLLLQMTEDSESLKFISALQSFKRRVAYANIGFDHLVGWSTSSLRRRSELPKRQQLSKHEKYPHIMKMERAKSTSSEQLFSTEAKVRRHRTADMEEEMITSLTKLSWERVDVYFSGTIQRIVAHNTIQVNRYAINSAGADVISHIIDHFLL